MSFADWLCWVIEPALGLKTIPDLLDINSTYTAFHMPRSPHHTPVTTWVMYATYGTLREAAKIIWLLGLEYAKFSLHEKWNNCRHLCQTVMSNGLNTINRRRVNRWAWPSRFTGGISVIKFIKKSFIHSYDDLQDIRHTVSTHHNKACRMEKVNHQPYSSVKSLHKN